MTTAGALPRPLPQPILNAAAISDDAAKDAVRDAGGTPLLDGPRATFVYIGDVEAVGLHHWMDVFPRLPSFFRHPGTNVWHLSVDIPATSRIEYKLSVKRNGRRRLVNDPLNGRIARDPFGANSLVTGPAYRRPAWSVPNPAVPAGDLTFVDVSSEVLDDVRRIGLYLPNATHLKTPLPLLIAHDGSEYAEFSALTVVLDNLIAAGDIPPVACALSDPSNRNVEYTASDQHAHHLVREVLPAVAQRIDVDETTVVALGASLGGVASLHAAWSHPGAFSGLILQSGSFVTALGGPHRRGPVFAPVVEFMGRFSAAPGELPARIHLSCGHFDGLIAENRAMAKRLEDLGYTPGYDEVADGHNWENWRDRLRSGLIHVFGR